MGLILSCGCTALYELSWAAALQQCMALCSQQREPVAIISGSTERCMANHVAGIWWYLVCVQKEPPLSALGACARAFCPCTTTMEVCCSSWLRRFWYITHLAYPFLAQKFAFSRAHGLTDAQSGAIPELWTEDRIVTCSCMWCDVVWCDGQNMILEVKVRPLLVASCYIPKQYGSSSSFQEI